MAYLVCLLVCSLSEALHIDNVTYRTVESRAQRFVIGARLRQLLADWSNLFTMFKLRAQRFVIGTRLRQLLA